jgi:pullulanase/glycogen debranching enzyme
MSETRVRLGNRSAKLLALGSQRPLGARIEEGTTVFRLFAPRASQVTVVFFKHLDTPEPTSLSLTRLNDGVWQAHYPADLHGWYYYYRLESRRRGATVHFNKDFRVLDPYALAAVGPAGPGIVWDTRRISPPPDERFKPSSWQDLVILEAHVRDLISRAALELDDEERRGFTGLTKWLDAEGCYLKSLGVNAVELQPVQEIGDFYDKRHYHWGYMTANFFAPESSYAQVPECGSQIEELQALVAAFHRQDIAVILDVVYNHVGEPNHLLHIDKEYYFHLDDEGNLTNWSGCGNDLRCDTPMGRRLIIDSLTHLVETYDVDGFRFDLAELIGVDVLKEIEAALKRVKPSVVLIAEPWSFRGHIALELKATGFTSWNDGYRDFLRDYVLGQGNQEGLRYFISGSMSHLAAWPAQTVNYVESHDDLCWIDRITENPDHQGGWPTPNDRRRTHLMVAILMSSLGIPMLTAGQDFLRSKHGGHNTHRAGEVNAIDYHRLLMYSGSHEYFRRWIRFRLSERGRLFRLDSRPPDGFLRFFGAQHSSALAVLFNADHSRGPHQMLFAVNPHHTTMHIGLADLLLSEWPQLADHERFEASGLKCALLPSVHGRLELPPLTCGLWEE